MRSIIQAGSTGDVSMSINFLAGPRRASIAFGGRIGVSILQAGSTGDSSARRGS